MCLSIPSKVISIDTQLNIATVDTMGIQRASSLDLMEDGSVEVGDYVLLHIGFIMSKIDEEDALESLRIYKEILDVMDEQERLAAIAQSDNCPNVGS
jgi:hydrogenase expression/formation protein HypC